MTTYYRDNSGKYLGGFDGSAPVGGIVVETAPEDARMIYSNGAWIKSQEHLASEAKEKALSRISEIRLELTDRIADALTGTPAEQGIAKAAIGLLRAELAIEKGKL